MADYIEMIRSKVGHTPVILNTAAGIVLDGQNRVLLQERNGEDSGWCVPGGYLEYGESFKDAVVREMKEDTGLDVEVIRPLGLFDKYFMQYPNGDQVQNCARLFLVHVVGGSFGEASEKETKRCAYFDFKERPTTFIKQNEDMLDFVATLIATHQL
ncbi:NUDIX hydrolase [Lacticaseibacillus thailandensis]|nr:NUDIX domain-containing protein [Lacticaseibacillus thailandensis]